MRLRDATDSRRHLHFNNKIDHAFSCLLLLTNKRNTLNTFWFGYSTGNLCLDLSWSWFLQKHCLRFLQQLFERNSIRTFSKNFFIETFRNFYWFLPLVPLGMQSSGVPDEIPSWILPRAPPTMPFSRDFFKSFLKISFRVLEKWNFVKSSYWSSSCYSW